MKRLMLVIASLAVSMLVIGGYAATGAPPNPKKTTICHWTGKKYVKVNVGTRALKGHMHHGADVMPAPVAGSLGQAHRRPSPHGHSDRCC